jgi:DNA-binding response OmpR family regulator
MEAEAKKVLVVDDNEKTIKLVKYNLEKDGFKVICSMDGLEGLSLARKEKPDIIVLDVVLPGIDGHRLCSFLKFDQKFKHIPIIMLTGHIGEESEKISKETGADAFLTKPYKPEVLLSKIKELISKGGQVK